MDLIIVESPTKAKTITKFLDKNFVVESSYGHVRDLPKSEMGIDITKNFSPTYIIPTAAKKNVTKLKKLAAKAEKIILATDEDREGEAIAWHLLEALHIPESKTERIAFHEITKEAINEALKNPRELDLNLVDAQQARRILDRLVGYELSPFLWKKVARGLSAGRVQSVAMRLIVEKEREILAFKPEEYWDVLGKFLTAKNESFEASLNKIGGQTVEKLAIKNKEEADKILAALNNAKYIVAGVEQKQSKKNPPAPFTTSTLQQAANSILGFSAKQTMMIAQQLYEGAEIAGEGQVGLITYMRTDSLNLSVKFLTDAQTYLKNNFDGKYQIAEPRKFKTKSKGAQEAHEAIRPTEASRAPEALEASLTPNQYKLYKLIWQRAVASQMPEAIVNSASINIDAQNTPYQFRATGQTLVFDGYLKLYPEKISDNVLPVVAEKEEVKLENLNGEQHFTKPPARYSDATLVKQLEEYGIGRPSTYAPTIATIIERNYVERDDAKKLKPTEIAFVVNDLLVKHFPQIVDFKFTADMENNLDAVAEGEKKWQPVIADFYKPFHENLTAKYEEVDKNAVMPEEKSDEVCEKCGSPMIIKRGRYGKFLACSGFPKCKNIKSMDKNKDGVIDGKDKAISEAMEKLKEKYKAEVCEKCGSPMVVRNGRFGMFLACSAYPKCKNIKNMEENKVGTGIACPACGKGEIVQKRSRRGLFYACSNYPACKNAYSGKPLAEKCPDCGALLMEGKNGGVKCSSKECEYEK
ncbi:MAG: type I DNA topoisomerase [Patescibacteria group bacterium]|nr:type I DNA topoisomerase [Patescibacteria group bacterium]